MRCMFAAVQYKSKHLLPRPQENNSVVQRILRAVQEEEWI